MASSQALSALRLPQWVVAVLALTTAALTGAQNVPADWAQASVLSAPPVREQARPAPKSAADDSHGALIAQGMKDMRAFRAAQVKGAEPKAYVGKKTPVPYVNDLLRMVAAREGRLAHATWLYQDQQYKIAVDSGLFPDKLISADAGKARAGLSAIEQKLREYEKEMVSAQRDFMKTFAAIKMPDKDAIGRYLQERSEKHLSWMARRVHAERATHAVTRRIVNLVTERRAVFSMRDGSIFIADREVERQYGELVGELQRALAQYEAIRAEPD